RLEGGAGNDLITGFKGNDTMIGGTGSDTFVWNPGDNSDVVEGGDGADVLVFNGNGAAETFTVSAFNGGAVTTPLVPGTRVLFQRDVGGVNMDMAGVEQINL